MLADEEMLMKSENQGNMPVLQTATAVATSFLIYRATAVCVSWTKLTNPKTQSGPN